MKVIPAPGFSSRIDDPLSVRQEFGAHVIEVFLRDAHGFSRTHREKDELRGNGADFRNDHPFSIRRESGHPARTKKDRWRSVGSTGVNGVTLAAPLTGFKEEDSPSVRGDVRQRRRIQPGELALFARARWKSPNAGADRVS